MTMKKTILAITVTLALVTVSGFAETKAMFSTDKFDNFTLHTYASFDAMADVSFIVEGKKSLVIIEPQAFKGKVEEFTAYTEKLGKPIKKVLVSFHAAGLKVYENEHKVIAKPMADFMKSDAAKGMLAFFDETFKGAMDTEIVEFDESIDASTSFTVDGVTYKLELTSLPGMPGVNIAIGKNVYYQHFAPAKGYHASKNQIDSIAAIDGALADANKARKAGYTLLLGSHGYGKAGIEDLDFQIAYLKTMKRIASNVKTAKEFVAQMNVAYPECKGEDDLEQIAEKLFPPTNFEKSEPNKKIVEIHKLIEDYANSVDRLDRELAKSIWSQTEDISFIQPRGHQKGFEEVWKTFYLRAMGAFSKRELRIKDVSIRLLGDNSAWGDFYWDFYATFKDGKKIHGTGRETQVWKKEQGVWKIVHVHYSNMPVTGEREGF